MNISASSSQLDQRLIDQQLYSILSECSSDAVVLVNQPGVVSTDFIFNEDTVTLWTQFLRYFRRSGSFLPYLQTSSPLDFDKITKYYIRKCQAEELVADTQYIEPLKKFVDEDGNPIEQPVEMPQMGPVGGQMRGGNVHNMKPDVPGPIKAYADTRKRVIRVEFPPIPLPDGSKATMLQRQASLFKNDIILSKVINAVPSPMVTIIYTTTFEKYAQVSVEESGPYNKYLLIEDLLRFTKDPLNRNNWKLHASRKHHNVKYDAYANEEEEEEEDGHHYGEDNIVEEEEQTEVEDLFLRKKLPLEEEKRLAEKKLREEESRIRKLRNKDTWVERIDAMITPEAILIAVGVALFLAITYSFFSIIIWTFRVVFSSSSQEPESLSKKDETKTEGSSTGADTKSNGSKKTLSSAASSVQTRKVEASSRH